MEEVETEINFSNILFENESQFLNNSFQSEINDLISENIKENNFYENSIEENISLDKKIPKIFPETNKIKSIVRKNIVSINLKDEELNLNSFKILKKADSKNLTNSLSRKTTAPVKSYTVKYDLNGSGATSSKTTDTSNSNKNNLSSKIEILNIILGEEKRTLILIENISSKINKKKFIEFINENGFKEKYDFIYFHQFNSKNINIYINFVNNFNIISFYQKFNEKKIFSNEKIILKFCTINVNDLRLIDCKEDFFQNSNYNFKIEIPLNYLSFFKKIYPKSVCIIKEKNLYNEGNFVVKKF